MNLNSVQTKKRNSSIEILRIIAMVFIILSHSSVHGCFPAENSKLIFNNIILDCFVLGNLGVDIFMIISGYFLCKKEKQSILPLIAQVWFYSIICLLAYLIIGKNVSISELISAIFPTIFEEYWFFTSYFIFALFVPYINKMLENISRNQLKKMIIMMFILFSILPMFVDRQIYKGVIMQFLLFYLIGAYLQLYPQNVLNQKNFRNMLAFASFFVLISSSIFLRFVFELNSTFFYERYSLPVIGCALGLTSMAVYHEPFVSPWINSIASSVFGIYLLHDNPFIRPILWNSILVNNKLYDSIFMVFSLLFSVFVIFLVGIICEYIRKIIFEKPLLKIFNKINIHLLHFLNKFIKV